MHTDVPAHGDERFVQQIILSILVDLVSFYEDVLRQCEEKPTMDVSASRGTIRQSTDAV